MTLVQEVKTRTDIAEVVSDYVPLQQAGRNLKAACPFHAERTPSFFVFPERQTWRCFGACATGGDVVSFVMKAENQEFAQALEHLAQRAGMTVPARQPREREDVLHRVNRAAVDLFRRTLHSPEGERARAYLEKRGINREAEEMFQLGLSPSGWDTLTRHLMGRGYQGQDVLAAGLAIRNERGEVRDLFHRRLMFPIMDATGQVAGFGGRALDDSTPKYLNTPRTPAFDKGHILYGLPLAREAIRRTGVGVVVEGYMDVIAAHQHGFQNVVASMGTALTEQQVGALRALASSFVLALDPDAAGQEATLRSLESSWRVFERRALRAGGRSDVVFYERQSHASLKVALLPQGKDPDLLIREEPEEWERLTTQARPLLDYLFEVTASRFDLSSGQGKVQAAEALFPFIVAMENPYDQGRHFRRLAELLQVSESALEASVGRPQRRSPQGRRGGGATARANPSPLVMAHRDPLEEYCLCLLLRYPDLRERDLGLSADYFELSENREIFTKGTLCSTIDEVRQSVPEGLAEHLETVLAAESRPLDKREREQGLEEVANRLKERFLKAQEQILMERLEEADWRDISGLESSISEAQGINQRLRELFSGSKSTAP